jgi:hypothetical protein
MPRRPTRATATWLFFFAFELAALKVFAQMVGSRDLTSGWRVPSEHISVPQTCEKPRSSLADGEEAKTGAPTKTKELELTIVETSPAKLEIGNDFNATVRLKNVGAKAVLVPSAADGERALRTSADGTEEKYEVGDISFRVMTGKQHGIPVYLNSAGALFADPDDKSSYLSLEPGNWLEIKLHARVECGLENCMGEIQPDNKAVLTAWWYQRVLTHRVNGCDETHGSFTVRELDSAPFTVTVKSPSAKTSAVVWNQ